MFISWSTYELSAQVMDCWLTSPNPCLNQCWPIINGVLWHYPKTNSSGIAQDINDWNIFENTFGELLSHPSRGKWVKSLYWTLAPMTSHDTQWPHNMSQYWYGNSQINIYWFDYTFCPLWKAKAGAIFWTEKIICNKHFPSITCHYVEYAVYAMAASVLNIW